MSNDTYLTIKSASIGAVFKDKGSKFLGFAYPIHAEEEIKPIIEQLKKEHHAARHWCYAWQLGVETISYRANDDGEPNNSAGKPIYGQILSKQLTNVLVVVVRYYGGVNLGVGGLIQAYKTAAQFALESAKIIKKTLQVCFEISFAYKDINTIMRFIKQYDLTLVKQNMDLSCQYQVAVNKSDADKIADLLTAMPNIVFKLITV